MRQIKEYLLNKAPNQNEKNRLQALFDDASQPVGLFFNERLVNMPPQLSPHLHKALFNEIQSAQEEVPPPPFIVIDLNQSINQFNHYKRDYIIIYL